MRDRHPGHQGTDGSALRVDADEAAASARLAQLEYEAAIDAMRRAQNIDGGASPAHQRATYRAQLAHDRSDAAMQAWAEAELRALQARHEADDAPVDDSAAAERRSRSARNAAHARWRKRAREAEAQ